MVIQLLLQLTVDQVVFLHPFWRSIYKPSRPATGIKPYIYRQTPNQGQGLGTAANPAGAGFSGEDER